MQPDYYQILGISHAADLEEIKQATHTKINDIKTAFAVLSHADQRTTYDAKPNPGPHNHYTTLAVSQEANTAAIKAAVQARMKEIKEAYENLSKPETRAAHDSQWQATKAPIPHSPPIPLLPKMENVVVEQKLAPPPDRDKSQVFPEQKICTICNAVIHRQAELCPHCGVRQAAPPPDRDKSQVSSYPSPTVSLTNTESEAQEIELAGRDTRLRAVLTDVLIMLILFFFMAIFSTQIFSDETFVEFIGERTAALVGHFVVGGMPLIFIMINVVLLYRYGQTLGKRRLSIKIVDADGSRAGLLRILLVRGLPIIIIPLLFAIPGQSLDLPIIGTLIVLLDPLLIFQNSRRCLHDAIAKTIVVKVFPGKNDMPYGSLTGAIGASILVVVVLWLVYGRISAHTDDLKKGKVSEAVKLLGELETATEEYMAAHGEFPPTIDQLTDKTSGKYVARLVSNSKEFYLEATMSGEDSVLGGKILRLIYHPDTKTWTCDESYPNKIPQKLLPSVCQSANAEITANLNSLRRDDELSRSKVKVSEAIGLLERVKPLVEKYMMVEKGKFPPAIEVLALLSETDKASIKYTASIIPNPDEFYLEATLKKEDGVLAGKTVRFFYHPKSKTWRCSAAYPNGIPQEYLPSGCQSSAAEITANLNSLKREEELSRSKVSEAIRLLEGVKPPVEKYMAEKGKFPPAIELLALLSETDKASIKYTASIIPNPDEFYLEATLKKEDGVLAGKTVRFFYHPKSKTWRCSAAYPNGIPSKYLPSECK